MWCFGSLKMEGAGGGGSAIRIAFCRGGIVEVFIVSPFKEGCDFEGKS